MGRTRLETLDFIDRAPLSVTATRVIAAEPKAIFAVLADAPSWPSWFKPLTGARWTSEAPFGVGSTRQVSVGPAVIDEQFIAWEPGHLFAFTFTATSVPMARAGVERVLLEQTTTGTEVSYTMAVEPVVPALLAKALAPGLRLGLGRGLAGLEKHLRQRG